ncbi:MAG: hypothetical protein ACJAYU_000594 [Bradymonadia bacterium]
MDYAHAIVEHFVLLRGKGCAVSSADEGLLLGWEDEGIPLDIVIEGIDLTFEKKRDAPRSLQHCTRLVKKLFKEWAEDSGQFVQEKPTPRTSSSGQQWTGTASLPGLSDKQSASITRWRHHTLAPLRLAAEAMWTDLQAQAATDGVITDEVAAIIDEAVRLMAEENGATPDELLKAMG